MSPARALLAHLLRRPSPGDLLERRVQIEERSAGQPEPDAGPAPQDPRLRSQVLRMEADATAWSQAEAFRPGLLGVPSRPRLPGQPRRRR
jgi:hypothetical protein